MNATPEPRTYRPLPPGREARLALGVHAGGVLLGVLMLGALWLRSEASATRGALLGAGAAIVWSLGRAWSELRRQLHFARTASLTPQADALYFTGADGRATRIAWSELRAETSGGRLKLTWPGGEVQIGSREWEDGRDLTRLLAARLAPPKPPNFIALEPK